MPRREREQIACDLKPIYAAVDTNHVRELELVDENSSAWFPVVAQA